MNSVAKTFQNTLLIRIIVNRPLLNSLIVIVAYLSLSVTGIGSEFSRTDHDLWYQAFVCIAGLGLVVLLPYLLQTFWLGNRLAKALVGLFIVVALSGLWLVGFMPLIQGGDETVFHHTQMITLIAVILILMSLGSIWSPPLPILEFLTLPIIVGGLVTGIGIIGDQLTIHQHGDAESVFVLLLIYASCFGLHTAITLSLMFKDLCRHGVDPREACLKTVSTLLPVILYGFCICVLFIFLITSMNSVVGLQAFDLPISAGAAVLSLSAFAVLFVLPGLLLRQRQSSLSFGSKQTTESSGFRYPGFEYFERFVRSLIPVPSAYALLSIATIMAVTFSIALAMPPSWPQSALIAGIVMISGIIFLSLRTLIVAILLIPLTYIVSTGGLTIIGVMSATYTEIERLIILGLLSLLLGGVLLAFRNISEREKKSKQVVSKLLYNTIGPYLIVVTSWIGIFLVAFLGGFYSNGMSMAMTLFVSSIVQLILMPAVITVMASRYGQF